MSIMSADSPNEPARKLMTWLGHHAHVAVLTGAGISTASGIPDYRDANGDWKRKAPMTHQTFVTSLDARKRYWARSLAGWHFFSHTKPNTAHHVLAELQQHGLVDRIVTQNVDRLHQKAGSTSVIDLHGRLDRVVCLDCATRYKRDWLQIKMQKMNPDWLNRSEHIAPDGDADIDGLDFSQFEIPACPVCGGMLKPDVVFHGGSIPRAWREEAETCVTQADGLLIVGSSLMIGSAYRLVRLAMNTDVPMFAINQGRTRADELLQHKLTGDCAEILAGCRHYI